MKIFVTGGAGFIGSNFVYYMLEKHKDYDIVCLDALTYAGNIATLKEAIKSPHFKFVKIDITDRENIFKLFEAEKPDMVVNFAAESHVDRSIINPEIFLKTNILGTQVLMDACREYNV
ncbi:MAG: GDP-mannose 4,6-dehydratase, partial [Clostridia bacterium]|nr:GDP-mannose 4,6-dehydratase [Clostridia bacterium]